MAHENQTVIVGGGPVGLLTALYLAQRKDSSGSAIYPQIRVLEKREDLRKKELDFKKTPAQKYDYNVVISFRGLNALSGIPGLREGLINQGTRYNRMQNCIRTDKLQDGFATYTPGEKISIERNQVVILFLNTIEKEYGHQIKVEFNKAVADINFDKRIIYSLPSSQINTPFENFGDSYIKPEKIAYKALIGADGARSIVGECLRKTVLGVSYMNLPHKEPFASALIPHEELRKRGIKFHPQTMYTVQPASKNSSVVFLPNLDSLGANIIFRCQLENGVKKGSGECSHTLKDSLQLRSFLLEQFPTLGEVLYNAFAPKFGVLDVEDHTTPQLLTQPRSTYLTTKYSQYNHPTSPAIIIGDAAHTMPPTIGQGINCGFGDVRALNDLLDETRDNWEDIPKLFNQRQHPEAQAIQDLSIAYLEETGTPMFKLRLGLDIARSILAKNLPRGWIHPSTNQLLSQSNLPYTQVLRFRQRYLVTGVMLLFASTTAFGYGTFLAAKSWFRSS